MKKIVLILIFSVLILSPGTAVATKSVTQLLNPVSDKVLNGIYGGCYYYEKCDSDPNLPQACDWGISGIECEKAVFNDPNFPGWTGYYCTQADQTCAQESCMQDQERCQDGDPTSNQCVDKSNADCWGTRDITKCQNVIDEINKTVDCTCTKIEKDQDCPGTKLGCFLVS